MANSNETMIVIHNRHHDGYDLPVEFYWQGKWHETGGTPPVEGALNSTRIDNSGFETRGGGYAPVYVASSYTKSELSAESAFVFLFSARKARIEHIMLHSGDEFDYLISAKWEKFKRSANVIPCNRYHLLPSEVRELMFVVSGGAREDARFQPLLNSLWEQTQDVEFDALTYQTVKSAIKAHEEVLLDIPYPEVPDVRVAQELLWERKLSMSNRNPENLFGYQKKYSHRSWLIYSVSTLQKISLKAARELVDTMVLQYVDASPGNDMRGIVFVNPEDAAKALGGELKQTSTQTFNWYKNPMDDPLGGYRATFPVFEVGEWVVQPVDGFHDQNAKYVIYHK